MPPALPPKSLTAAKHAMHQRLGSEAIARLNELYKPGIWAFSAVAASLSTGMQKNMGEWGKRGEVILLITALQ